MSDKKKPKGPPDHLAERLFNILYPRPPECFEDLSFDLVEPVVRRDVEICLESLFTAKPIGLILLGIPGTGKSSILHLIWSTYIRRGIARLPGPDDLSQSIRDAEFVDNSEEGEDTYISLATRYFKQSFSIRFFTHWDLIAKLRSSDNGAVLDRSDILFEERTRAGFKPVLLIDDLGRGFDDRSGWNLSLADEFFNFLWERRLPIIVTTNKTEKELRAWPGWARIVDRIADPAYTIPVRVAGTTKRCVEFKNQKEKRGKR